MNLIDSKTYIKQLKQIVDLIPDEKCTILVSGATGLIGSCIVDTFLLAPSNPGREKKVIVLGRNLDKMEDRFSYAHSDRICFLTQDVIEPIQINDSVDYIIHTASNSDPIAYSLYPVETLLTNVYGTNNVLEYCKRHNNTRLLFTSTFEVYGRIDGQDVYKEDDSGEINLNAIRSCYPESKRCSEILMRGYKKEYDIDYVIARLCSIYGPTMSIKDSKAHAQFIRNGLAGEDIVLKSKGDQKRTYCYLMDAISGILTVLFKGQSGEAYNVSNEEGIVSIAELARIIADICGTNIIFDLPSETERMGFSRPQNCILDNKKLRELGWKGSYTIKEGIQTTMDILRELNVLNIN